MQDSFIKIQLLIKLTKSDGLQKYTVIIETGFTQ